MIAVKKKNRVTLLNILSNIILQITNIITWFIIPKIILSCFGSDVNGLVSSISQFLSYISLVEGGISGVVMASLYKPLVNQDNEKLSSVIRTSDKFYKRIGLIFVIYSILLGMIYPIIFKTGFSYLYVFSLVIILAINLFIQYMFSITFKNLLNADKKGYIVSFLQSLILILGVILSYISVLIYPSIHILKFITGIIFVIQPIIFSKYVNKNYNINRKAKIDNDLIKQRWNGFAINVAAFIHNCTDIAILTIFTNLATVSIYSVYTIVTNGLRAIYNAISSAIVPTIGQAYAKKEMQELDNKLDLYEFISFTTVFFMFTITGLLITPFIVLYTKGVNDANYNQALFGVLIVLSEALYLIKSPHLNLAYSANKFKELTIPAYIEAIINIVISIILVNKLGIVGVAIGTIIAMLYRLIFHINYTKKIINRNQWIFYRKLLIFVIGTLIGLGICYFIPQVKYTIASWIIHAIIYSIIFAIIYSIISVLFFKKELEFFKGYLFRKKGDKNI